MAWYAKWDYSCDLSKGGVELSFRQPKEMVTLLVENDSVRKIAQIISNPTSAMLSSRHYLIGGRGLGKSTILNYIAYRLLAEVSYKKVMPIYVSLLGKPTNEQELEKFFFRSCLEGMLDLATVIPLYVYDRSFEQTINRINDAIVDYKMQVKKLGAVSLDYVYTAFENQLNHLSKDFVKILFLVDGLDKQNDKFVLGFFRNTQERFNTLITKFGCCFINAADPSWRDTLEMREFSGVRGVLIALRGWTLEEVGLLVRKRLESLGIFKMPFQNETVQTLVEDFQGNPREILQHATVLLHYAAKQKIESIEPRISRSIVWKEEAKHRLYDSIVGEPDLQTAYQKLKGVFDNRQLMNILIAAYGTDHKRLYIGLDYERRSSLGVTVSDSEYPSLLQILRNKGCLRDSKIANHVEIESDVLKLFDLVAQLKQPLVTLPVVLSELSSKIIVVGPAIPEEVSLKKEIETVFQQNSGTWLNYEGIKSILLENSKRQAMFLMYFGEDYLKKITSSIPLIVAQLLQQENLMKDEENNVYRRRPNIISVDLAIKLPYKDILDDIQAAKEISSPEDLEKSLKHATAIYNKSLAKLDSIFERSLIRKTLLELEEFFENSKIDHEEPIPLRNLTKMMTKIPATMEEADVLLGATLVYSKRILERYEYYRKYEKDNLARIGSIKSCTIGKSKEKERGQFNELFLKPLLDHYGETVNLMSKMKTGDGYVDSTYGGSRDLGSSLGKAILKGQLFKCRKCGRRMPIASTGDLQAVNCAVDGTPMEYEREVLMLSKEAYETWTVWLEEYVQAVLTNFPSRYKDSGLCLKPRDSHGVSRSSEVDGVIVYNGLSIALECIENVSCNEEKNDLQGIVAKAQNLGLFDAVILVYRFLANQTMFDSIVDRHKKFIYPLEVRAPAKFKIAFWEVMQKIAESAQVT